MTKADRLRCRGDVAVRIGVDREAKEYIWRVGEEIYRTSIYLTKCHSDDPVQMVYDLDADEFIANVGQVKAKSIDVKRR